ncbi:MAG: radical SAM protein [Candidatus Omnitrophica bacterium]|nr:radical SAM protein [Candidatus Omnitrophota bacterium]
MDYYTQLAWVDEYIKNVAPFIYVRDYDNLLIKIPNEAYKLNEQALKILKYLLEGESVYGIVDQYQQKEEIARDIHNFFCDLRAVLKGCFHEQQVRKAIEKVPFGLEFNTLPVLSEIALTYKCNLSCKFCYASCGCSKNENFPELSTEQIKNIILIIKNEVQVPSVSFTGGEPTLREDLAALIAYAKSQGMWTNLITNGTLITTACAKKLKSAGLDSAQVSLEAGTPGLHDIITGKVGAFTLSLEGLKDLMNEGIRVHTNTTISALNKKYLLAILDLVKEIGLEKFSMNMLMPQGSALENKEQTLIKYEEIGDIVLEVADYARKLNLEFMWYSPTPVCIFNPIVHGLGNKGCAACDGLLSIAPDGNILPCSSFPKPMGNILKMQGKFKDIWQQDEFKYFKQKLFAHAKCRACEHLAVCNGGCPLYFEQVGYDEILEQESEGVRS